MATKPNQAAGYRAVPSYLRELREKAGLTQRGLAARLKRPQWFVHRTETGSRRIDPSEFIDWSQACGVDPRAAIQHLMKLRR